MLVDEIIRAWKDEEYRLRLSDAEQSALPQNPAGLIELADEDLGAVEGGTTTLPCEISKLISCWQSIAHGTCGAFTIGCCS